MYHLLLLILCIVAPTTYAMNAALRIETAAANCILTVLNLVDEAPLDFVTRKAQIIDDRTGEYLVHTLIRLRDLSALRSALEVLKVDPTVLTKSGLGTLHYAVVHLHEAIPLLIHYGAVVDQPDKLGKTALATAVTMGNLPAAKALLACGPNVEFTSAEGSLLYCAVALGHEDIASCLMDSGAQDRRVRGNLGEFSPFELAIQLQRKKFISHFYTAKVRDGLHGQFYAAAFELYLIPLYARCGYSPATEIDAQGRSPLHFACPEAVDILVRFGCDPTKPDSIGITPIHTAAASNEQVLARYIELRYDLNVPDQVGESPIYHAIAQGHERNFKQLYKRCDLGSCNKSGESILHAAIRNQKEGIVTFLLKEKKFIGMRTIAGETPLLYLARYMPHLVATALAHGAKKDERDTSGRTMLHVAAAENPAALAVVRPYCDINGVDGKKNTPLMLADQSQNAQAILLLLAAGADKQGVTVPGASNRKRIHFLTIYYPELVLGQLAANPSWVSDTDDFGWTAAHYATVYNPSLLPNLTSAGVPLEKPNADENTPFALAFLLKDPQTMKQLRSLGACASLPTKMLMRLPKHIYDAQKYQEKQTTGFSNPQDDAERRIKLRLEPIKGTGSARSSADQPAIPRRGFRAQGTERKDSGEKKE